MFSCSVVVEKDIEQMFFVKVYASLTISFLERVEVPFVSLTLVFFSDNYSSDFF